MSRKYTEENLLPALKLFIRARNEALTLGFTDNGGAIHSVERILDILSQRIKYPNLSHTNQLKNTSLQSAVLVPMRPYYVKKRYLLNTLNHNEHLR